MSDSAPSVAVIGGGISGLSTAFYLRKLRPAAKITLFESGSRLGGNIRTERRDEFLVDAGPDSFMRAKPAALELCGELGLSGELMGTLPGARRVCVARAGRLQAIPDGLVMGVPTRLGPLLGSRFLSLSGKLRMLAEAFVRRGFARDMRDGSEDESIAAFMTRRFGTEAAQRFAAPMLAGIFAGDAEQLSMSATFPQLCALEQQHGSVIWGILLSQFARVHGGAHRRFARLRAALQWLAAAAEESPESPFLTLRSGMGTLISTLANRLGETRVLIGQKVDSVQRAGDAWSVFAGGNRLDVDAVVLASPAHVAAKLVAPGTLKEELRAIRYASTATVFFGFDGRALTQPLTGAGFIVPPGEGRVLAGTWITSKWQGRAPDGSVLVRAFLGGVRSETDVTRQDDAALAVQSLAELRRLAGGFGTPRFTSVHRHIASSPQPSLGHRARIARINGELTALPGLHLAGAAYDGVSISDCVRQARRAAERIAGSA